MTPRLLVVATLLAVLSVQTARAGGAVQVLTDATGARIQVDGVDTRLKAPGILVDVPAGQHSIVLIQRCRRGEATVEVVDGDSVAVEITLEEIPGSLLVRPDPPEAEVTIDGASVDGPTDVPTVIGCGEHTVSARDYGHVPALVTIFVGPGEAVVLPVKLASVGVGFLQISVVPTNARLRLDGQHIGEGRLDDFEVIAGAHALRAELDGYEAAERQFVLADGGTASFDIAMRPLPKAPRKKTARAPISGAHIAGMSLGMVGLGAGVVAGFEFTQARSAYDEYLLRKRSVEAGRRPVAFADEWFDEQVLPHRSRMQVAGIAATALVASGVVFVVTF